MACLIVNNITVFAYCNEIGQACCLTMSVTRLDSLQEYEILYSPLKQNSILSVILPLSTQLQLDGAVRGFDGEIRENFFCLLSFCLLLHSWYYIDP